MLWTPKRSGKRASSSSGERARDGDYALNDLDAVRSNPFEVMRDFEGFTNRDLFTTTAIVSRKGEQASPSSRPPASSTGRRWTDGPRLHAAAAGRRARTQEDDDQFTQEVRFASAPAAPIEAVGQRRAALAGRRAGLHAELRSARGQHDRAVRAVAVHPVSGVRRRRPRPRSMMRASASTGRARSRFRIGWTCRSARASTTRTARPTS